MMSKEIILGTRGSKLALFQTNLVLKKLQNLFPECLFKLKKIITKGDKDLASPLETSIEKGFFVKEIQENLIEGKIDIAVHSLKDLPVDTHPSLSISAILRRGDHRDCFISKDNTPFEMLPSKSVIATSSNRRRAQILHLNPLLKVVSVRGNIDTRINKMIDGYCDGLVLASVALERLQISNFSPDFFDGNQMLNAPGQGAVAVETRSRGDIKDMVKMLDHIKTRYCVDQERLFLKTLKGGCTSPIASYCSIEGDKINLKGTVLSLNGQEIITKELESEYNSNVNVGINLASSILKDGGERILADSRSL